MQSHRLSGRSLLALAVAGAAFGIGAAGAIAIGVVAIGQLAIGRARVARLEIVELSVEGITPRSFDTNGLHATRAEVGAPR